MKLYQAGLLLAGAVLATGIAFKMTQPPPIPIPAPAIRHPVEPAVVSQPEIEAPVRKPSPLAIPAPQPTVRATAPETIYDLPPKPPTRKNEPNLTATLRSFKPKQWIPGRYESTGKAASVPASAAIKAPSAPVVAAAIDKSETPPVEPAVEKQPAVIPPAPARHATLTTGMAIVIRLDESLSSDVSRTGGTFAGVLAEPVIADGFVIAEPGARVTGRIVESEKAGRFTGNSRLSLGLMNVSTSDGQTVSITTDPWMKLGDRVAAGTIIPFRLKSKVSITEQQVAAR